MRRLVEPGYGRNRGAKVLLFVLVLVVSGVRGAAVGPGRDGLARLAAIVTLLVVAITDGGFSSPSCG